MKSIKGKIVSEKNMIVTADIGKDKHYGFWRCPDGTDLKPFAFRNDGREFQEFWERISRAKNVNNIEEIVFGYESTGSHAEQFVQFLLARGVHLVQVNPMHTKRVRGVQGNSPIKTDEKDPKVIADSIALGQPLTVVVPEGPAA
jgi:transposase